jgi:hypothetical protein
MKTKSLVIVGIMIIALAAMAVPVMAGTPGDVGGGASGNQDTNATLAVNNASANFGTFAIGANLISASNDKSFPEVVVASNEAGWSVSMWANPNPMSTGVYTLANPLKVKNEMASISGITNELPSFTSISTNSGSQTKLISGTPIYQSNVTLAFQQDIIPIDTAANNYATVLHITYASHV